MYRKIKTTNGNGYYLLFQDEDVEYTNPIKYYSEIFIRNKFIIWKNLTKKEYKAQEVPEDTANKVIYENVIKDWEIEYEKINKTEIPQNFIKLLSSSRKKEQISLLKRQSLTPLTLLAFIFKAWKEFGFSFSEYKSEHNQKGFDESTLPELIHIDNDKVKIVGNTPLTNGKLKQVIEHRKVIVSKFLDKKNYWHCFFITFNSVGGKESWKNGQPHLHYISNQWGISRDEAVKKCNSGNYPTTSVHIELLDYRWNSKEKG